VSDHRELASRIEHGEIKALSIKQPPDVLGQVAEAVRALAIPQAQSRGEA
jgi:hypothetical protein